MIFNDKYRLLKITAPLLLITLLIFYAQMKGPHAYPGYKEAKDKHEEFTGKKIYFGGKIVDVQKSYITIESDKLPVKAYGVIEKNKTGHSISGQAIYQKDGSLKIILYHTSNLRNYKIFVSILPILIICYFFLKEYRFDFAKMIFEKIQNPKLEVQNKLNSKRSKF